MKLWRIDRQIEEEYREFRITSGSLKLLVVVSAIMSLYIDVKYLPYILMILIILLVDLVYIAIMSTKQLTLTIEYQMEKDQEFIDELSRSMDQYHKINQSIEDLKCTKQ